MWVPVNYLSLKGAYGGENINTHRHSHTYVCVFTCVDLCILIYVCVCPLRRCFTKKCPVSHDRVSEQKIGITMNKLSFEEGMLSLL